MVQDREMRDEAKKRKERRERLRRLALKAEEEGRPSVSKEMSAPRREGSCLEGMQRVFCNQYRVATVYYSLHRDSLQSACLLRSP